MAGTKIDQFLNIRHSKRFAQASSRVRETEVSFQLPSNHPASPPFYLVAKLSREAENTVSFSAFVLMVIAGFVALGSLTRGKGSTWFRLGPSKDVRPIGVVPV
jgi:hypothetical protein